jgi:hypothetical protein
MSTPPLTPEKGILRDMPRYCRTWYLLFRLRLKKREAVASPPEIAGVNGIADGNFYFFGKQYFLKELSQKRFFIFPRSLRAQRKRMGEDDSLLDICINETPQRIVQRTAEEVGLWRAVWQENMADIRANTPMIRITGHGEDFADITNFFFVYLPSKYKWLGTIFLAICGIVWLSVLKVPICSNVHIINSWYVCQ